MHDKRYLSNLRNKMTLAISLVKLVKIKAVKYRGIKA